MWTSLPPNWVSLPLKHTHTNYSNPWLTVSSYCCWAACPCTPCAPGTELSANNQLPKIHQNTRSSQWWLFQATHCNRRASYTVMYMYMYMYMHMSGEHVVPHVHVHVMHSGAKYTCTCTWCKVGWGNSVLWGTLYTFANYMNNAGMSSR